MISYLARQDFAQRFTGNTLGVAWAVLAPVLQLALFAFVFGLVFQARIPGLDGLGYVVYLSLGMWPWFAFSDAVSRGATALTDQATLLGKVALPPWQLVAARVLTAFGLHGGGFLVVLVALSVFTPHVNPAYLPLTLLAWMALAAIALASAIILSVIHIFFRDLQQIVQYGLTAVMFLTPILYSVDAVPAAIGAIQAGNPFNGAIAGIRDPLMSGDLAHAVPWLAWCFAAVLALLAAAIYRRFRAHLVDFL